MSARADRRSVDSLELLERMINNTALSTKRVTHFDILDLGEDLFKKTYVDVDSMKAAAVKVALAAEEKRHVRELKAAVARRETELHKEKEHALARQKQSHEDLAKRVAEQRDKAEEERVRQLGRHYDMLREEALAAQWEECERLKAEAIVEATATLRGKLRREFNMEREQAIAAALDKQKTKFLKREQESMDRVRQECEQAAQIEAERVAEEHAAEIKELRSRYKTIADKLRQELDLHTQAMIDFRELQTDYQRFMDYTEGRYHSDYMMRIRRHGLRLASADPVKPVIMEEVTTLWET